MASTNKTTYYELPVYIGTDIPNPLTDWNGAMNTIDETIHDVAETTAEAVHDMAEVVATVGSEHLDTTAQTVTGAVNELKGITDSLALANTSEEANIAQLQSAMTQANQSIALNSQNITSVGSRVTVLENQNGSQPLQTTAQTLSGAVNELDDRVTILENAPTAVIDDEMSTTSENAVQNKVITEYVDLNDTNLMNMMLALERMAEGEVKAGTITAGNTSITLTFVNETIGANTFISVYSGTFGVNPTNVTYTSNTVTVEISAQASDTPISVMVFNRTII